MMASLAPLWSLPERRPGRLLAAIGLLFALLYAVSLVVLAKPDGRIVIGDALEHYVQLRSLVFDHDLQFRNEYARIYGLTIGSPIEVEGTTSHLTPTGHVRNYMPFGPALLWAPGFLLVTLVVWLARLFGSTYPLDGYARAFQASVGFTGIAAAAIGTYFAYRAAERVSGRRPAIWAALAMWSASSALYYSSISPTYSHAASMLTVGVFWFAWIATLERQTPGRYALLGGLVGACALMRWQDAMLMLIPALDVWWHRREAGAVGVLTRLVLVAVGAAVAFLPQMAVWMVLYGRPLTIPQGPSFMRWGQPALWRVLVSDQHGLISWTPIVALAIAGLAPLTRERRIVGVAAIVFVTLSWYVNAAVSDWWAGEAFGARRFLSCYPMFVSGVAAIFARWRLSERSLAWITIAFAGTTLLLLIQYQAFMHGLRQIVPYPSGFSGLYLRRFTVPFDLLRWALGRGGR